MTVLRFFHFAAKLTSIVVDAMGSCGSLSGDVRRPVIILRGWGVLFETFPKLKLGLDFGQNMSTLNRRIAVKLGKNIWREDNDEQNGVGRF